jgi:hypothetical protein
MFDCARPAQRMPQLTRGLPTLVRILLKAGPHYVFERRRDRRTILSAALAREHLIQHPTERVNIRPGIGLFAFPLFRRHVTRRPHHRARLRHGLGDGVVGIRFHLSQTEIQQLDPLL